MYLKNENFNLKINKDTYIGSKEYFIVIIVGQEVAQTWLHQVATVQ